MDILSEFCKENVLNIDLNNTKLINVLQTAAESQTKIIIDNVFVYSDE